MKEYLESERNIILSGKFKRYDKLPVSPPGRIYTVEQVNPDKMEKKDESYIRNHGNTATGQLERKLLCCR